MERLKSILADEILNISAGSGDEVKAKLDRIQRFRDFAYACKTLMTKYPVIEDELIEMVKAGDFDTKIASSRVDNVIRVADTGTVVDVNPDEIPMEIIQGEEEPAYRREDIESEEMRIPEANAENEYISYEEVNPDNIYPEPDSVTESILKIEDNKTEEDAMYPSEEEIALVKRKTIIKRIVQVVCIVLAVLILIFIIRFVKENWQTILIITGILTVLAILLIWFRRKRD